MYVEDFSSCGSSKKEKSTFPMPNNTTDANAVSFNDSRTFLSIAWKEIGINLVINY